MESWPKYWRARPRATRRAARATCDKSQALGLIVSAHASINFEKKATIRLETGIDGCCFERTANEKRRRGQKGERESDLCDNERIARQKFPAAMHGIVARLFLQVGDDAGAGKVSAPARARKQSVPSTQKRTWP